MVGKNERWGRLLIITIMIILTAPLISLGAGDTGRDWYCSEPETHTGDYKKHLKLHIDHGADRIAAKLEKIFNNQSLTSKEKQAKTTEILNRYLLQAKAGMGD
jgi:hypothetical protein